MDYISVLKAESTRFKYALEKKTGRLPKHIYSQ